MRGLIFPPTNNFTQLKLTPVFFTDRISLYDIYGPYIMYVKGKGSGSEDWGAGGGRWCAGGIFLHGPSYSGRI